MFPSLNEAIDAITSQPLYDAMREIRGVLEQSEQHPPRWSMLNTHQANLNHLAAHAIIFIRAVQNAPNADAKRTAVDNFLPHVKGGNACMFLGEKNSEHIQITAIKVALGDKDAAIQAAKFALEAMWVKRSDKFDKLYGEIDSLHNVLARQLNQTETSMQTADDIKNLAYATEQLQAELVDAKDREAGIRAVKKYEATVLQLTSFQESRFNYTVKLIARIILAAVGSVLGAIAGAGIVGLLMCVLSPVGGTAGAAIGTLKGGATGWVVGMYTAAGLGAVMGTAFGVSNGNYLFNNNATRITQEAMTAAEQLPTQENFYHY